MRTSFFPGFLFGLIWATGAAHAQGSIELQNTAEVEISVKAADGTVQKQRMPAKTIAPGTEVIYTTTFKNVGVKSAGNISIKNPIPAATTLVGGSPWGNADITYSADGGQSWATVDKIKIKDTNTGKERPASLTEVTHIRWALRGELPAGQHGDVGFRVKVN